MLYLAERAWCPLGVLGVSCPAARCGAFDDDFEAARGWAMNPDGTDTATTGRFARATRPPRLVERPEAARTVPSGSRALVDRPAAGARPTRTTSTGRTIVRVGPIRLPTTTGQRLFFRYVFAHGSNSSSADRLVASIETSGGARTPVFTRAGTGRCRRRVAQRRAPVDPWKGQTIRIHIEAVDGGANSLVEAQIEDVRITRGT